MSERIATDPFLVAFGKHLRFMRRKAALTQEETAERAGIHVTYLSGVERGIRNPSIRNVRKLAQALGVPTRRLFFFKDPTPPPNSIAVSKDQNPSFQGQ
jgi:transcriptional regulator with XRE-family HTH domain